MDFPQLSDESLEALCGVVARCTDKEGRPVHFYPADVLNESVLRQLPLAALLEGSPFLSQRVH